MSGAATLAAKAEGNGLRFRSATRILRVQTDPALLERALRISDRERVELHFEGRRFRRVEATGSDVRIDVVDTGVGPRRGAGPRSRHCRPPRQDFGRAGRGGFARRTRFPFLIVAASGRDGGRSCVGRTCQQGFRRSYYDRRGQRAGAFLASKPRCRNGATRRSPPIPAKTHLMWRRKRIGVSI